MKRVLLSILAIGILLLSACGAPSALPIETPSTPPPTEQPTPTPTPIPVPPPLPGGEEVIDALDTDKLLDIGYNQPDKIVTVEGGIVSTYYARGSKGQPTFLNFHDPYEGYFTAVIWGDDRGKFPPNPESYYLYKKVRIKGKIEIYKGDPEIILRQPSQIWVVE